MDRSKMQNRYKKSHESAEAGNFINIFKGDISLTSGKEGNFNIIILSYEMASKNHPLVRAGEAEIGDPDYVLDLFVHKKIGPKYKDIVCPHRNYGTPYDVLDNQAKEFYDAGKEKEYSFIKAKRKVYYNVLDADDLEKGVQILEQSYVLFEKEMIEEATAAVKGDGYFDFSSDENHIIIVSCRVTEEIFRKAKYFKFKAFKFTEVVKGKKDEDFDFEAIRRAVKKAYKRDQVLNLDDHINISTNEEIEKIVYLDEEGEEEKESSKDGKSKKEAAKTKTQKTEKKGNKCSYGHKFGVDTDKEDFSEDCNKCDDWDDCTDAFDKKEEKE